jgi:hypothetical protein
MDGIYFQSCLWNYDFTLAETERLGKKLVGENPAGSISNPQICIGANSSFHHFTMTVER